MFSARLTVITCDCWYIYIYMYECMCSLSPMHIMHGKQWAVFPANKKAVASLWVCVCVFSICFIQVTDCFLGGFELVLQHHNMALRSLGQSDKSQPTSNQHQSCHCIHAIKIHDVTRISGENWLKSVQTNITRWWFHFFLFSPRSLGKWSNLTSIFQMGWKHQLAT